MTDVLKEQLAEFATEQSDDSSEENNDLANDKRVDELKQDLARAKFDLKEA